MSLHRSRRTCGAREALARAGAGLCAEPTAVFLNAPSWDELAAVLHGIDPARQPRSHGRSTMTPTKKTKKKETASRSKKVTKPRTTARALKKAVPPPDDPWLRHEAEEQSRGGGTDRDRALARVKAIEQTRRMPTDDTTKDES